MATLSAYYRLTGPVIADGTFSAKDFYTFRAPDLNGDGKEDLLVMGAYYPFGQTAYSPQQGRVLFGDGNGGFRLATAAEFPQSSLLTVHPRKVVYADFNGDGRTDFFIADHGFDANPFPGAQNRLFLSRKDGGFDDASATLPQISDFTHTAAAGDIDGDGDVDIFAGNGYDSPEHILSYMLMNDGKGNFTQTRANIPGANSVLDFTTVHHFPGATLTDLDGDRLPELLITADAGQSYDRLRQSVILWNKNGVFSESAMTQLPAPAGLPAHIDTEVQKMDFNYDGRPDLVVIGTNGQPFYDGAFVQLLRNDGNGVFTDVTASGMAPSDALTAAPGAATSSPWAMWVKVLDFNGDGVLDFAVEYYGASLKQATPLVWLNDGAGHFTTLKVGDFVAPGEEWRMAGGHFYKSDNGYSYISAQLYPGSGGLNLNGLVATKAYREHAASPNVNGDAGANQFVTTGADNRIDGGLGFDIVIMTGARASYQVTIVEGGVQVRDTTGVDGTDTLIGIERVRFTDHTLAFDVDGVAGQAYRVYQAAFARTPDAGGLGYWISNMEHGMSLKAVAENFVASAEFTTQYGANPSNGELVSKFYQNVLHRAGEPAGVQYWTGLLDSKTLSLAEVLMGFSESTENQTALVGVMSVGMDYIPFG